MRAEVCIRRAGAEDRDAVVALIERAGLPVEGVAGRLADFHVAVRGGRTVGACGLETYGPDALLRSVAVADDERGSGTGRRLVERALSDARERGLASVVLLTTSAADYFRRFGFEEVSRDDVSGGVRASGEFSHVCPSTATVMRLSLRDAS
jgi:amino-acid N-acetyltransferase